MPLCCSRKYFRGVVYLYQSVISWALCKCYSCVIIERGKYLTIFISFSVFFFFGLEFTFSLCDFQSCELNFFFGTHLFQDLILTFSSTRKSFSKFEIQWLFCGISMQACWCSVQMWWFIYLNLGCLILFPIWLNWSLSFALGLSLLPFSLFLCMCIISVSVYVSILLL